MKRLILTLGLFFSASGQLLAATVDLYADNRTVATGTAQVSGSDTTHIKCAATPTFGSGFTITDVTYAGLHVTAGTSAPAQTTGFKVTAVDNTDPTHPILTVNSTLGATPAANWTFTVLYGSNVNTGASQTPASGTTGPVNSLHYALSSSALSAQDVGYVHIRGNTGNNYSQAWGPASGTTDRLIYNAFVGSTKSFILEGYVTTASPSDLATDATKTSTYYTASASNPAASVLKSAGQLLYEDTTTTGKFPHLRYTDATPNYSIAIGDPAATNPYMTLRYLKVTHPATSGATTVINMQNSSTNPSLTVTSCIIGSLDTTDDNGACIGGTSTGFAPTNAVTISKSVILSRRYGVSMTTVKTLSIDQSYIECYGKDNAGSTVNGIYAVKADNSTAATYNAAMTPTNQVLQLVCTDNNIIHTATHSAGSTTAVGIQVNKSVEMEICRIKGNNLYLNSQATGINIIGAPSFDVQNNRLALNNATLHGVAISVGADATVEANPTGNTLLLVASGTCGTSGSQVAYVSDAAPAHTTFTLTGGSATDAAYQGMLIRRVASPNGAEWTQCWNYTGSTKVAKCTPQLASAPLGNSTERWEVWRPRFTSHGVIAHNLLNSVQLPTTSSHALGMFQGCDHVDAFDNTAIGYFDNGIVLKGEFNRVSNNRISGGRGCLLIKGGSWNEVTHNTFYQNNSRSAGGCFQFNDKSNVNNMAGSEVPLNASHWSKTTGNRVTDNIFINASTVNAQVIDDNAIGAGSWAGGASEYPMGQANIIDYNVYYQAHASAALGNLNGSTIANGASITTLQAAWAAYSTALQYRATNDAHSSVGTITLSSPSTGDFRVTGGTASARQGSDGQLLGASRGRSYLIPR